MLAGWAAGVHPSSAAVIEALCSSEGRPQGRWVGRAVCGWGLPDGDGENGWGGGSDSVGRMTVIGATLGRGTRTQGGGPGAHWRVTPSRRRACWAERWHSSLKGRRWAGESSSEGDMDRVVAGNSVPRNWRGVSWSRGLKPTFDPTVPPRGQQGMGCLQGGPRVGDSGVQGPHHLWGRASPGLRCQARGPARDTPAHAQAQWWAMWWEDVFGVTKTKARQLGQKEGSVGFCRVPHRNSRGCGWACAQGQGQELLTLGWVPLVLQAGPSKTGWGVFTNVSSWFLRSFLFFFQGHTHNTRRLPG